MDITVYNKYIEKIDIYPDICPHCHKHQIPEYISGLEYYNFGTKIVEAFFQCTNSDCNKGFIAYYYKGVLREISNACNLIKHILLSKIRLIIDNRELRRYCFYNLAKFFF